MDAVGLITLGQEVKEDARLVCAAVELARERLLGGTAAGLEAAGYQLARAYNILEQMALRIAKAFENHIDDERGWHSELMQRMMLSIPGIRPALFQGNLREPLRNMRGFRHVVTHAYDLALDPQRMKLVLEDAEKVAAELPGLLDRFVATAAEQLSQE